MNFLVPNARRVMIIQQQVFFYSKKESARTKEKRSQKKAKPHEITFMYIYFIHLCHSFVPILFI